MLVFIIKVWMLFKIRGFCQLIYFNEPKYVNLDFAFKTLLFFAFSSLKACRDIIV